METKNLNKISAAEKIVMAEKIWDSVSKKDIEIPTAIKYELDNRLKKVEEEKAAYYTWEEIKHHLDSIR
jgi:putative addiction module component (TIGR02574 family)